MESERVRELGGWGVGGEGGSEGGGGEGGRKTWERGREKQGDSHGFRSRRVFTATSASFHLRTHKRRGRGRHIWDVHATQPRKLDKTHPAAKSGSGDGVGGKGGEGN
jgi:hypothetical protein